MTRSGRARTARERGSRRVEVNGVEVTILYADNDPYLVEVRFEIPGEKWFEFERSPMYRRLKDYVCSLQTPDRQTGRSGRPTMRTWASGS